MIERGISSAPRARAAAVAATCLMLGSGYVSAAPDVVVKGLASAGTAVPAPTDAFCRANFGQQCYSPYEIRTAYGLNGLIDSGMVGTGQTIVLIESFGSPTIASDLEAFDEGYGLPPPPSLTVLARSVLYPLLVPLQIRSAGQPRPRSMSNGRTPSLLVPRLWC